MPALGDYLGLLLAEITNARLQADLESARIAQLYASHPLLQHMPVPRFRLPNVTLDLPVAVEKLDQPSVTTTPPAPDLSAVRKRIDDITEQELGRRQVHLTPSSRTTLKNTLDDLFDKLKTAPVVTAWDATQASERATTAVLDAIRAGGEGHTPVDPALESSLGRQFGTEFVKLQRPPARVQVIVVTGQLKDIAPAQILTRIQLTISEEGVEWTQTNPSDTSSKTLLPE